MLLLYLLSLVCRSLNTTSRLPLGPPYADFQYSFDHITCALGSILSNYCFLQNILYFILYFIFDIHVNLIYIYSQNKEDTFIHGETDTEAEELTLIRICKLDTFIAVKKIGLPPEPDIIERMRKKGQKMFYSHSTSIVNVRMPFSHSFMAVIRIDSHLNYTIQTVMQPYSSINTYRSINLT